MEHSRTNTEGANAEGAKSEGAKSESTKSESTSTGSSGAHNPLETVLKRLREALGDLAPEPLLERLRPVMEGVLEPFQLVPRRDYEAHLTKLARLEDAVATLETRVAELEAQKTDGG